jgi:hypothetical protein
MLWVNFFYIKNTKKKLRSKVLGFSAKLYPRILDLAITPDPKVIFIIIIIILNLHDPVGLALIPDPIALDVDLTVRSCHKSMIIK